MLTLTDCYIPGTVAGVGQLVQTLREKIMSILTRAAVYTVRIAAGTAAAPVLAAAAAASATAKLVEFQLVGSPLSAEYRELAAANGGGANTPARQQGRAGNGDGHRPESTPAVKQRARFPTGWVELVALVRHADGPRADGNHPP